MPKLRNGLVGSVIIKNSVAIRQIKDEMDRTGDKSAAAAVVRMIDRYTQSQNSTAAILDRASRAPAPGSI